MMAFNPATFNAASLLAASQPATPVKDDADAAIRLLAAGGPLFGGAGLPGFPGMGLPFPIYPGMQPEMKPDMMPPAGGGGPIPGYFFDAMGYHPYAGGLDGSRRKNATRETTSALKAWLNDHRKNPYPTKGEKVMLAVMTKMTLTQVSTWFANARRRLKKENKMTWSPRNRPGEDDDLADLDALDESARPGSSASNCSNKDGDFSLSNNNDDDKASPAPSGDSDSPRKKIWSIAEQLNEATTSAGATATTQSDEQPAAAEWQQQMGLAMQRLAAMQQQQQQRAAPPMPALHGLPPMFMPMLGGLHPMLLMMQQAAAAAAAQTAPAPVSNQDANGSWSDRPSLSPSASPVAEQASLKQEDPSETVKQEEQ